VSDAHPAPAFKQLPRTHIGAVALVAGFAVFMIWDQVHWWRTLEDYSFGFLVPLFVAYVVYDRWPLIRSYLFRGAPPEEAPTRGEPGPTDKAFEGLALVGFLGSLLLYGIGALLRSVTTPQNPASLAIAAGFAGILLSLVFIFAKERADGEPMPLKHRFGLTLLFLFPALIWLISAPMVSVLETKIRVFLLTKVTIVVFNVFDILGYALEREGNVLILPEGQVGVEEACSGIRSLTACLFAGSFLAAVFLDRFWKKVLLVFAAMCFAVLTNMIRSLFLTLWAYHNGANAIDDHWVLPIFGDIGSVHDVTGLAILGVTCVGLILLLPIFNFKVDNLVDDDDEDEMPDRMQSNAPNDAR